MMLIGVIMRLAALVLALALSAAPAAATCAGTSLLAEIEKTQPEVWKKTLADFDAIPNATGVFWKIEKTGTDPSWLLGTMHLPDADATVFDPAVADALAKSEVVVLEIADLAAANRDLAGKLLEVARLPDSQSFDAGFTQQQKDALGKMTAAVGMPYFMARRMQPWFLAIALSTPPCVQVAMLRGEQGLDAKIEAQARAAGKRVEGLETVDEQLAALASLQSAIGPDMLLEFVRLGEGRVADLFATLIESYTQKRPSLDLVLTLNMPEFKDSADVYRATEGALLHDRNARMHDRLLPILEKGNAFVAVGALHLPGEDGLIELLRADGYTVSRAE